MKNLKKLMERREELKQQLAALVDAADQEERAMTERGARPQHPYRAAAHRTA